MGRLLPEYNAATPFSKIEILRRSIALIEDYQQRRKASPEPHNGEVILKSILVLQNMQTLQSNIRILESDQDLENGFRAIFARNNVLTDLLHKANISAPPFAVPKCFEHFVSSSATENNCNELNVKPVGRPPKYSNKLSASGKRKIQQKDRTITKVRKIKSSDEKPRE